MAEPEIIIPQQPEEEIGGAGAPGAAPGPAPRQGGDVDLDAAAQTLKSDERTAVFMPSALVVSIVGRIICGATPGAAAAGRPATPQERFEGFAGMLLGDERVPGLLTAIDFDANVLALLSRSGVGANLSPGVAVAIGAAAIVGAAFMFKGPKQPKTQQPAPAAPVRQATTGTAAPQPAGATS